MKRQITFKSGDEELFRLLHEGFCVAQPAGRPIHTLRMERRVLEAMEAISTPNGKTNKIGLELRDPILLDVMVDEDHREMQATMTLFQSELDLLVKYLETVPWAPVHSRKVVEAVELLNSSPQIKE